MKSVGCYLPGALRPERVTVLRDGSNLGTYWVRDIDRRRLGELITGQVFESTLKEPFLADTAPTLEVRGATHSGQKTGWKPILHRFH